MKKVFLGVYFAAEWVLFAYTLMFVLVLQAINMANVVLIDMPWEETITLTESPVKTGLLFLLPGSLLFLYVHFLQGNRKYRMVKEWAWGFVIVMNFFGSLLWLTLSFASGMGDRLVLVLSTIVSLILSVQIAFKYQQDRIQ